MTTGVRDVMVIVLITISITSMVVDALYSWTLRRLQRKNQMLRRLLMEQAELREMSLEAYTAMLREAQRHMGR